MRPQNDFYLATERREIIVTGLANPPTGTINTNVLVFAALPTFALGTFNRGVAGSVTDIATQMATWVNSATLGTSCTLLKRGRYSVTLVGDIVGDLDARFGISLDMAAGFVGLFGNATAGMEVAHSLAGEAGVNQGTCLTTTLYVSDAMDGAGRGIVRFHAVLQDGNPITSPESFGAADMRAQVRYMGDFMGA